MTPSSHQPLGVKCSKGRVPERERYVKLYRNIFMPRSPQSIVIFFFRVVMIEEFASSKTILTYSCQQSLQVRVDYALCFFVKQPSELRIISSNLYRRLDLFNMQRTDSASSNYMWDMTTGECGH